MNKAASFAEFLATQSVQLPLLEFVFNLALAALLSSLLAKLYIRYGDALSNRTRFAKNFMLLTMTTMLVISIVKASLALSLGLVGALSIVRFRAAIKEPEELSYLFLAIGIGLGLGADQRIVTVIAFSLIAAVIWARGAASESEDGSNLFLTVAAPKGHKVELAKITGVLSEYCSFVNMRRLDESKDRLEALFIVEFDDASRFHKGREKLRELDEGLQITFLDNKGVL